MIYAIAHRGLSEAFPENSLDAFAAALEHTSILEVDIRATSDGVLVCTHDGDLQRCFADPRKVGQVSWAELSTIAPDVPALDDVLERFGSRAGWFLDCKVSRPRVIEELERLLEQHSISLDSGGHLRAGQTLPLATAAFTSKDAQLLQSFRGRTHAGCLELITGDTSSRELVLTAPFITAYAQGVVMPDRLATRAIVRALRALRLGVYVYTVNDAERMSELAQMGVSAVFTDVADQIA